MMFGEGMLLVLAILLWALGAAVLSVLILEVVFAIHDAQINRGYRAVERLRIVLCVVTYSLALPFVAPLVVLRMAWGMACAVRTFLAYGGER